MVSLTGRFVFLVVGLIVFGVFTATEVSASSSRYAIVIGVNSYPNLSAQKQLTTAVNDANALGAALGAGGLGFDRVVVLTNPNLAAMGRGINDVANQLKPGDTILFFFSGHGISPDNTNLLLASDLPNVDLANPAAKDLVRKSSYSETEIITKFQTKLVSASGQQEGVIIFVSDACRDNPFGVTSAFTKSIGEQAQGVRPQPTAGIFSIYAAGIGQQSLDRLSATDPSTNSVFMRVFLQKITMPRASLADVAVQVRQSVAQLARTYIDPSGLPHTQVPAYYDETLGGVIALSGGGAFEQPRPQGPIAPTIAYKNFDNRDLNGGDLGAPMKDVDLVACVTACRSQSQCVAFSYDKWHRWCFLKNQIMTAFLEPNTLTGIRQDFPAPQVSNNDPHMEHYYNKAFLGDPYQTIDARSYDECVPACKNSLSCVVFTFMKAEKRCTLFHKTGGWYVDARVDSGVKRQDH
jgi:hypothetical protein